MKALFFHTVRMLVRQRDVLVWVIAFPLVLATLFHVMFANFDEYYRADPVSCAVVADENYHATRATFFREMLAQVSAEGDDQLLDVREVANADAAADEQRETRCKRGKAETAALNEHKQNALPEIRPVYKRVIHGKARDTRGGGRREKRVHRVCEPPAFRRDRQREQHGADKNKYQKADDEHARG